MSMVEHAQGVPPITVPYPDGDLLGVGALLTDDERERLRFLRTVFQQEIRPVVGPYWDRAEFPFELLPTLARLDLVGGSLSTGSHLLSGLVHMELTRADTSVGTCIGVHNELFVAALQLLGSDEQRRRLLPDLLALRSIGAFALTEPQHGSDISRQMETRARRDGDEWVLTGSKRWIGNGTIADHLLIWARDEADREIKGFIVEADRPGFTATKIEHKIALRIVQNADIRLDEVRIPARNLLPGAMRFADANVLLRNSRVWVGWQAVGQQFAAFDVARSWALSREQFGEPLAARQLVQEQLSRMIGNATMSLSLMIQLARLQEVDELTIEHASLAKASCSARMRETVQFGRSLMGGNGISTDFEMAKIFADAEAIYSYEGTYEVNSLIVGRAATGLSAFD